jgi:hypothetical protein
VILGQIGTSTITGRVTDPTGAVVPGVSVAVVNTDTNFRFGAQTNTEGLFRVQSLQTGLVISFPNLASIRWHAK